MFSQIIPFKPTQTVILTSLNFSTTLLLRRFFYTFAGTEHEADRRLKSLLFSEMDGIHSGSSSNHSSYNENGEEIMTPPRVVVLATTNVPWDLDEAMRRRLEKRIYVPLPNETGRNDLMRLCLNDLENVLDVNGIQDVVSKTKGFSGSDMKLLCREAAMAPMRKMLGKATPMEIVQLRREGKLNAPPPVSHEDFVDALTRTRSSVQEKGQMERYEKWNEQFGSS